MKATYVVSFLIAMTLTLVVSSCSRTEEITLEEYQKTYLTDKPSVFSKTISKPWKGEEFLPGRIGGIWQSSMTSDPKSFNLLVSERDSATSGIVGMLCDSLLDYDYVRHEFKANCASARVEVDEQRKTVDVIYTLRDDLYWSYQNSEKKIKVTSDDVVFWYDEIEGDPAFNSSAYNSQFVTMEDGTEARVTIKKLDDRRFVFHFPRIDSNPLLSTNRNFGPRFLYEKAKKEKGPQGVLDLFSVATNVADIPSMGMWFLTEYTPGQRLVFKRNPNYWNRDVNGASIPYPAEKIIQIVPDKNTQRLLFKEGKTEAYLLKTEDIEEFVNAEKPDYTVFAGGGSLSSFMWSFNQNQKHKDKPYYAWFTKKEFRQAMSCLVNRQRIIDQAYRGLAEPALSFFAEPNPFYDSKIQQKYLYDRDKAIKLLASIGMTQDAKGVMRDSSGMAVEFDLTIYADNTEMNDTASILADECAKIGVTINLRAIDFQKIVEDLTSTYDWQSVMVALGENYWPTQGANVWPSSGNLHLWYPLQKKPATDWEARVDYLYNEGNSTLDHDKAKKIWDEYQSLILEECPIIYMVRPQSFYAVRNRVDFTNLYYDNVGGLQTDRVWLRE